MRRSRKPRRSEDLVASRIDVAFDVSCRRCLGSAWRVAYAPCRLQISDPENPLEEPCCRADRQLIGALLFLIFRHGKSVARAAVELHLEFDLGLAEFLVNLGHFFERV